MPPIAAAAGATTATATATATASRLGGALLRHCRATSSFLFLGTALSSKPFTCSAFVSTTSLSRPRLCHRSMSSSRSTSARTKTKAKTNTPVIESNLTHVDADLLPDWMRPERTRVLTKEAVAMKPNYDSGKSVVYWMQRDMRTEDNWALLYAQNIAKDANLPLEVCYVMPPPPLQNNDNNDNTNDNNNDDLPPKMTNVRMTERHGSFLLGGLEEVHDALQSANVPFHIVKPSSDEAVGEALCKQVFDKSQPCVVVCDFSPLRQFRQWIEEQAVPLLTERDIPLHQVDAHNVVPVWHAAEKRQVGARTLRPKIQKLLSTFLQTFPEFEGNAHMATQSHRKADNFDKNALSNYLQLDASVPSVNWAKPGTKAGMHKFRLFTKGGLKNFDSLRNDPTKRDICSNLSPWINYGHISFQRLALEAKGLNKYANGTAAFIEEGMIRRELSDNFCYWEMDTYDSLESAAQWAQDSLDLHASDEREYLYTLEELEQGNTHDDLWNAAELQMVQEGKMHGFLRMYWAKKVLEWTESPLVALRTAQYLNDKYSLDGNDPNGFVGIGWSIMGIHDMGWKERPVFGKIRFMNYAGCKRKFKVAEFVEQYPGAADKAIEAEIKYGKKSAPPKLKNLVAKKNGIKRKSPT